MSKGIGKQQRRILAVLEASEKPMTLCRVAQKIRKDKIETGFIFKSEHSEIISYDLTSCERGIKRLLKEGYVERKRTGNAYRYWLSVGTKKAYT